MIACSKKIYKPVNASLTQLFVSWDTQCVHAGATYDPRDAAIDALSLSVPEVTRQILPLKSKPAGGCQGLAHPVIFCLAAAGRVAQRDD